MKNEKPSSKESPIDYALALERVGGDEEFLKELLILYTKEFLSQFKNFQEAIKNRDFLKIQEIGHTLKGSSANLSLEPLQEVSFQMELAGKSEDIEKAKETLALLDSNFQKLKKYLQSL